MLESDYRRGEVANECPKCHAENPDVKKFCGDCGIPLEADVIQTKKLETRLFFHPKEIELLKKKEFIKLLKNESKL